MSKVKTEWCVSVNSSLCVCVCVCDTGENGMMCVGDLITVPVATKQDISTLMRTVCISCTCIHKYIFFMKYGIYLCMCIMNAPHHGAGCNEAGQLHERYNVV